MKENLKETKGITLVALAITIVVMIILAGITIETTVGKNGLITIMRETEKNEILAEEEGQAKINELKGEDTITEDGVKIITDEDAPTINSLTVINRTANSITVKVDVTETKSGIATIEYSLGDGSTDSYVKDVADVKAKKYTFSGLQSGTTYTIKVKATDEIGNETIAQTTAKTRRPDLPYTATTKPYFPGDDFRQVTGTNLNTGLVIEDSSGNQYVWVEVPKTTTVYPTAGLGITTFDDTVYTKIENDLHTYTMTYRDGTVFTDAYYADSDNIGWFADETEYNTAKQNMLKSVYENGGFWIGRYETGIENAFRTASGEATQTPVIKANAYPYNYVTRTQAKVLAESMESGDRTSSLMFGVQWDLVLAFMHNKGGVADSTLTSDSTTIGNYYNNLWSITNTLAKYSNYFGTSWSACPKDKGSSSASILLTTGADLSFEIMNIYDIAGNVKEWTLEYTFNSINPCATRGGSYDENGSFRSISNRNVENTTGINNVTGFRVSLY